MTFHTPKLPTYDLYAVLGVVIIDDRHAIQSAFRRIARECHPDVAGGDNHKTDLFKKAAAAWEILGDADNRARYDRGPGVRFGLPPNMNEVIRKHFQDDNFQALFTIAKNSRFDGRTRTYALELAFAVFWKDGKIEDLLTLVQTTADLPRNKLKTFWSSLQGKAKYSSRLGLQAFEFAANPRFEESMRLLVATIAVKAARQQRNTEALLEAAQNHALPEMIRALSLEASFETRFRNLYVDRDVDGFTALLADPGFPKKMRPTAERWLRRLQAKDVASEAFMQSCLQNDRLGYFVNSVTDKFGKGNAEVLRIFTAAINYLSLQGEWHKLMDLCCVFYEEGCADEQDLQEVARRNALKYFNQESWVASRLAAGTMEELLHDATYIEYLSAPQRLFLCRAAVEACVHQANWNELIKYANDNNNQYDSFTTALGDIAAENILPALLHDKRITQKSAQEIFTLAAESTTLPPDARIGLAKFALKKCLSKADLAFLAISRLKLLSRTDPTRQQLSDLVWTTLHQSP